MFQSTHPHRVRRYYLPDEFMLFMFQSTHPHRVRLCFCCFLSLFAKFQSTHPHRVRHDHHHKKVVLQRFQSTHPHRVRQNSSEWKKRKRSSFNPRTHTGCDFCLCCFLSLFTKFQSTHPHRVRLHYHGNGTRKIKVSIHAPTQGATGAFRCRWGAITVSIHAPTQGATITLHRLSSLQYKFQSTHPHRVRPYHHTA